MRICTVEIREMVNNFYAWDVLKSHKHQAHLTHLCLVSPFQSTSLPENYHRSIILDLFRQSDTLTSILYSNVCHSKKLPSLFCSIMQCHLYAAYSLCVCFVNFAISPSFCYSFPMLSLSIYIWIYEYNFAIYLLLLSHRTWIERTWTVLSVFICYSFRMLFRLLFYGFSWVFYFYNVCMCMRYIHLFICLFHFYLSRARLCVSVFVCVVIYITRCIWVFCYWFLFVTKNISK